MADKAALVAVVADFLDVFDEEDDDTEHDSLSTLLVGLTGLFPHKRARIHGYVEEVVPGYTDDIFKRIFRMSRHVFTMLVDNIKDAPELVVDPGTGGHQPVCIEKQLLVTLWYFGGLDTINKIADRFGISESTVIDCRNKVSDVIIKHLKSKFILWPTIQELQGDADLFAVRNGFPGIIGALDGTHIPINKPQVHPQRYVNRKGFHSLQLQAVCRHDMQFSHVFVGFPGSCHDARVLRNSDLWDNGLHMCNMQYHLVADAAYPLRRWLLTPYRDNGHLTNAEKKYNNYHSANRMVIERAFGLLKGRFRRLQQLNTKSLKNAVETIMACCVVHNICILSGDDVEDYLVQDDANNVNQQYGYIYENEAEGALKRATITRNLQ